jgi:biopolymer transport protein ExbD
MKAATLVLLVTGWLFSLTPVLHAQETKPDASCTPSAGADDEEVVAARAFQELLVAAAEQRAMAGDEPFPSAEDIPAAEKLCQEVVKKATTRSRQDIADAATQLLEAFKYSRENLSRERAKRTKPGNAKLQEMYGENAAGVTDGFLMKGYAMAQFRLGRLLGPTTTTEEEIRAMEDFDLAGVMEELKAAEEKARHDELQSQKHLIHVTGDGSVHLDGVKMKSDDALKTALLEHVTRASKAGKTLRVALRLDRQTRYVRIVDMMNILAAAKIIHVTSTVGEEEEF